MNECMHHEIHEMKSLNGYLCLSAYFIQRTVQQIPMKSPIMQKCGEGGLILTHLIRPISREYQTQFRTFPHKSVHCI
jgi:hypothetical protein